MNHNGVFVDQADTVEQEPEQQTVLPRESRNLLSTNTSAGHPVRPGGRTVANP